MRPSARTLLLAGLSVAGLLALSMASPRAHADPRDADATAAPVAGEARPGKRGRLLEAWLARRAARRAHAAQALHPLDLTAEQRAAFAASKQAAAPVREDTRAQLRALVQAAREGERTPEAKAALRAQVRAVLASARRAVEPSAAHWVGLLTAEQKARLAARAEARGRTYDEAKVVRAVSALLLAPEGQGPRRAHRFGWGRRAR